MTIWLAACRQSTTVVWQAAAPASNPPESFMRMADGRALFFNPRDRWEIMADTGSYANPTYPP